MATTIIGQTFTRSGVDLGDGVRRTFDVLAIPEGDALPAIGEIIKIDRPDYKPNWHKALVVGHAGREVYTKPLSALFSWERRKRLAVALAGERGTAIEALPSDDASFAQQELENEISKQMRDEGWEPTVQFALSGGK